MRFIQNEAPKWSNQKHQLCVIVSTQWSHKLVIVDCNCGWSDPKFVNHPEYVWGKCRQNVAIMNVTLNVFNNIICIKFVGDSHRATSNYSGTPADGLKKRGVNASTPPNQRPFVINGQKPKNVALHKIGNWICGQRYAGNYIVRQMPSTNNVQASCRL